MDWLPMTRWNSTFFSLALSTIFLNEPTYVFNLIPYYARYAGCPDLESNMTLTFNCPFIQMLIFPWAFHAQLLSRKWVFFFTTFLTFYTYFFIIQFILECMPPAGRTNYGPKLQQLECFMNNIIHLTLVEWIWKLDRKWRFLSLHPWNSVDLYWLQELQRTSPHIWQCLGPYGGNLNFTYSQCGSSVSLKNFNMLFTLRIFKV